MALILDGKKAQGFYKATLVERSVRLLRKPTLAILQIGNNSESSIYIAQKKKFGEAIGASVLHLQLAENTTSEEVASKILGLNLDENIHGIIIQLPLPPHLDKLALINLIDPRKDVDGLTDTCQDLLSKGNPLFVPATAKGVGLLLDFYKIDIQGKNIVVFGKSRLVGYPTARLMEMRGGKVAVCDSKSQNPKEIARSADILIVAIGKPELIGKEHVRAGATVIDVGINPVSKEPLDGQEPGRRIVGDVDFKAVESLVSAISPVPGGVGPMTVLALFDNLISSAESMSPRQP